MDKDSDYLTFLDDCALAFKAGEIELIKKAYDFALIHHKSDVLYNHEALIKHSLGISEILLDLNVDSTTIIASIIHETINYGDATKEEIESLFGSEVYKIVKTISKLKFFKLYFLFGCTTKISSSNIPTDNNSSTTSLVVIIIVCSFFNSSIAKREK